MLARYPKGLRQSLPHLLVLVVRRVGNNPALRRGVECPSHSQSAKLKGKAGSSSRECPCHFLPRGVWKVPELNVGRRFLEAERALYTLTFQGVFSWGDLGTPVQLDREEGLEYKGPEVSTLGLECGAMFPLSCRAASDKTPL